VIGYKHALLGPLDVKRPRHDGQKDNADDAARRKETGVEGTERSRVACKSQSARAILHEIKPCLETLTLLVKSKENTSRAQQCWPTPIVTIVEGNKTTRVAEAGNDRAKRDDRTRMAHQRQIVMVFTQKAKDDKMKTRRCKKTKIRRSSMRHTC